MISPLNDTNNEQKGKNMSGMNGTKLSGFLLGLSVGGFPVVDLFEDVAMGGEELVVFGSSFASPGFLAEGTDVGTNVSGKVWL